MRNRQDRMRHRSRLAGVILSAGVMTFAVACEHGGVANPTAPSAASTTADTSAPTLFDALARDGGRVLVPTVDTGTTGWSGTCTVTRSATRGSFKAAGTGPTPNTVIMVWLVVQRNGFDSTRAAGTSTNKRGVFRSPRTTLSLRSTDLLRCELRIGSTVLAASDPLSAP